MEKLVKEILAAAKMGDNHFQLSKSELIISDMVKKCCREIQGSAEDKGMNMVVDLQSDCRYLGDKNLLHRAFMNSIGCGIPCRLFN